MGSSASFVPDLLHSVLLSYMSFVCEARAVCEDLVSSSERLVSNGSGLYGTEQSLHASYHLPSLQTTLHRRRGAEAQVMRSSVPRSSSFDSLCYPLRLLLYLPDSDFFLLVAEEVKVVLVSPSAACCRSEVQTTPHINWIDNYSHFLKVQMPTADSRAWRDCQWTVHGLITTRAAREAQDFDDDWLLEPSSEEKQLMPLELFKEERRQRTHDLILQSAKEMRQSPDYYSECMSKTVRRLPLKPENNSQDPHEVFDSMPLFLPKAVVGENVSSNKGLVRVFKNLLQSYPPEGSKPIIIMADVNIYKRLLKVALKHSPHLIDCVSISCFCVLSLLSVAAEIVERVWSYCMF